MNSLTAELLYTNVTMTESPKECCKPMEIACNSKDNTTGTIVLMQAHWLCFELCAVLSRFSLVGGPSRARSLANVQYC